MHKTRNDLPVQIREKVSALLNERLADLLDLKLQAKQAHWNVKGPNFIALHELFDEVADVVDELSDTVAERITALGFLAEGTVQVIGKRSSLAPYPTGITAWRDHVEAFATAIATAGKAVRAAIDTATDLRDADTADLFTEVSRALDKQLWFVEAHVQDEK